ncbi:very short patch repair endonuclease [Caballeronia sordidicola]|uniref:very short patch repair endonuclease n=1 Tax=Caballeronia sordidicola TaxID=196367 RepID=UPI00094FFE53|nr:very short patch repair endonuclease [Caballeronia sordidicola]
MDRLSKEHRSWLMSRVKSKDTTPELVVRSLLFAMGFRYRLHDPRLPGRPDIVFGRKRKVIFVHGCFWHGHRGCRYGRLPKTRVDFWGGKIERNRERDLVNLQKLDEASWQALTVWQCELKDLDGLADRLYEFLTFE